MKKTIILLVLFFGIVIKIYCQEKRTFTFRNVETAYYVSTNFKKHEFILPNLKANIILVDDNENLLKVFEDDSIHKTKTTLLKDQVISYYVAPSILKDEKTYKKFLMAFIKESFNKDFYNRNEVTLTLKTRDSFFSCESLDDINMVVAKIIVPEKNNLLNCKKPFIVKEENSQQNLKTTLKYETITIKESEQKRKDYKLLKTSDQWKGTYFISVKLGHQEISKNHRTEFDKETLINFNELNSIWSIDAGYMFSHKFGGYLNFGILYKKEQKDENVSNNVNGVTISGSGSGAGVVKLGLGVRYIPFAKDRWSIYSDLIGGFLNAKAGGGSGSVIISIDGIYNTVDKVKKNEKTNFVDFIIGATYRLGGTVFLTSNFQYTISNFKNDIGSVSGFSGYTVNLGVGFSFK